jgi:hypothetical protein
MILVDTSVWVDHLRSMNRRLAALLDAGEVVTHPFVIGELACGNLRDRAELLALLDALPGVRTVTDREVRDWIETRGLWGRGFGWVDAHLLSSALLAGCRLWTMDARLRRVAAGLGIAA